jgi:hypothetical protein
MHKIATTFLIVVVAFLPVECVIGQPTFLGYPGYSVNTTYSQPANLGNSMFVAVNVTNLSYYIAASVDSVKLTFDWGTVLFGETPWPLQPGENNTWRFEQVDIPSSTWSGTHVCLIDLTVSFAYPTWRLGRILTYQNKSSDGQLPMKFEVRNSFRSDTTATIVGPRLVRVVSNVTASPNQAASLISLTYRVAMVGFVVAAVVLLTIRSYLQGRSPRTEDGGKGERIQLRDS